MKFYANYARNCVVFRGNLHSWHKFYTTAGCDGRDKSQLWTYSQCANYTHYQRNSITTPNLHPSVGRAEEKKTSFTFFVLKKFQTFYWPIFRPMKWFLLYFTLFEYCLHNIRKSSSFISFLHIWPTVAKESAALTWHRHLYNQGPSRRNPNRLIASLTHRN